MVIIGLIPILFGVDPLRLPSFIPGKSVDILDATLRLNTVFVIAVSLGLMSFMFWFIKYTRWGLAITGHGVKRVGIKADGGAHKNRNDDFLGKRRNSGDAGRAYCCPAGKR